VEKIYSKQPKGGYLDYVLSLFFPVEFDKEMLQLHVQTNFGSMKNASENRSCWIAFESFKTQAASVWHLYICIGTRFCVFACRRGQHSEKLFTRSFWHAFSKRRYCKPWCVL